MDFEPELPGWEEREAQTVLMEVALPLVAVAAKGADGFPQDVEGLRRLVDEVRPRLPEGPEVVVLGREEIEWVSGNWTVWLAPAGEGALHMKSGFSDRRALVCDVWPDGLVTAQGTSAGLAALDMEVAEGSAKDVDPDEPFPLEPGDEFIGTELRRVVPAPLQPGADVQVISVELYSDGGIIRTMERADRDVDHTEKIQLAFTEGDEELSPEKLDVILRRGAFSSESAIQVEDDLGTRYTIVGGGGGGGGLIWRASAEFSPAVPNEASVLRVQTDLGIVEIPLQA